MKDLATHLSGRRAPILADWRARVQGDPQISAANALPRNQFNDHVPALLDALQLRLRVSPRAEDDAIEAGRKQNSAAHGLLR